MCVCVCEKQHFFLFRFSLWRTSIVSYWCLGEDRCVCMCEKQREAQKDFVTDLMHNKNARHCVCACCIVERCWVACWKPPAESWSAESRAVICDGFELYLWLGVLCLSVWVLAPLCLLCYTPLCHRENRWQAARSRACRHTHATITWERTSIAVTHPADTCFCVQAGPRESGNTVKTNLVASHLFT